MTRNAVRAMFLGTCRVHEPIKTLGGASGLIQRSTPHRFHTSGQTLGFINHITGVAPYRPEAMHLVSDYAAEQIFRAKRPREQLLADLESLRSLWQTFSVFVIEICAMREYIADLDGQSLVVNTFSQRDQGRYAEALITEATKGTSLGEVPIRMQRQSPGDLHRDMRAIKTALDNRPIIWLSHMRPGGNDPQHKTVNSVRALGAATLCDGALSLGDSFFDPSDLAQDMGLEAFFRKGGEDLDHLTDEAAARLGQIYRGMVMASVPPPRFRRPPAEPAVQTTVVSQTKPVATA